MPECNLDDSLHYNVIIVRDYCGSLLDHYGLWSNVINPFTQSILVNMLITTSLGVWLPRSHLGSFFSGIKESSALRWWYNLPYSMLVNHDFTTATTVHCHQDNYIRLMGVEPTIIVASPESRCHCQILSPYTPDLWIGSTGMKTLDHFGKSRVYRALTYKQRCEEHGVTAGWQEWPIMMMTLDDGWWFLNMVVWSWASSVSINKQLPKPNSGNSHEAQSTSEMDLQWLRLSRWFLTDYPLVN